MLWSDPLELVFLDFSLIIRLNNSSGIAEHKHLSIVLSRNRPVTHPRAELTPTGDADPLTPRFGVSLDT